MGSEGTLADEAAAVAKIAELMAKVSKREAGSVTPETLVYDGVNTYEHREFLLNSKTVTVGSGALYRLNKRKNISKKQWGF